MKGPGGLFSKSPPGRGLGAKPPRSCPKRCDKSAPTKNGAKYRAALTKPPSGQYVSRLAQAGQWHQLAPPEKPSRANLLSWETASVSQLAESRRLYYWALGPKRSRKMPLYAIMVSGNGRVQERLVPPRFGRRPAALRELGKRSFPNSTDSRDREGWRR